MENKEVLKALEEKIGERLNYFELSKTLSQEETILLAKLIDDGVYRIESDENGDIWIVKREEPKEEAEEKEELRELRKDVMKNFLEKAMKREEMTLSEIAQLVITTSSTKMGNKEKSAIYKKIWFSLPIKNIKSYWIADEHYYEFEIENQKFKVSGSQILSDKTFRKIIFDNFGIVLPKPNFETFQLFLMWFKSNAEEIKKLKETESFEENVREIVMNYVNNSFVTDKLEETFSFNYIFLDGDGILIPSEVLMNLLKSHGFSVKPQKLAFILKDLVLCPSKPMRVKGMGLKRFWVFDKNCFEIKEEVGEE